MRYLFLLFSIYIVPFTIQAQVVRTKIETHSLTGLQFEAADYIAYDNTVDTPFTLYLKSDVCDLLQIERQASNLNLSSNVYISYNSKLLDLEMDETHNVMFPKTIYSDKDYPGIIIVELDLVNFIATRGYTYIILEFKNNGALTYAEFSESESIKNCAPIFKKYKRGEFEIVSGH